jgi:glutathione S-transferase
MGDAEREATMLLYDSAVSGNCYKVRLLLAQLGIPFERQELSVLDRSNRPAVLGTLNPALRVPTIVLDDGRGLGESNAILWYFGDGTKYVPTDRYERAQVLQWQFYEQYDHEPNIAVARFWLHYKGGEIDQDALDARQKGIDLLFDVLPALLESNRARFIALGSGEQNYETFLHGLQERFPGRAVYHGGYSEELAHFIEGGADMFLMPSRFEPCGLNQMYSLRYGTVPVVRRTGGLADSVQHFDPATGAGTGVVFNDFNADGLRWGLTTALEWYAQPALWHRLRTNGMRVDFSWTRSGCPVGRRPSVSTVNEITTGMPAACAARVTPIASGVCVIVIAVIMSASVSRNVSACIAW